MEIRIAENIKKHRKACGLTQAGLAALLSISTQAVSRWENGKSFPDISLLPLLAKYLDVSIDELIGSEDQQNQRLINELRDRQQMHFDDESEKLKNQLRICEIYEIFSQTDIHFLNSYFCYLMRTKNNGNGKTNLFDEKIANARQMLRTHLKRSSMSERIGILRSVALYEDEDKLETWSDEYNLPTYMRANFWDELLLERYDRSHDKLDEQIQKILYEHIQNTVYYLTDSAKEQLKDFPDPERYQIALDTLDLYSTRVDDIFLITRIIAEVRYAEALLINGRVDDSLAMFSQATEHLGILYRLPDDKALYGSVSVLSAVKFVFTSDDKLVRCIMNIAGCDRNPLYDSIRGEKRFAEYENAVDQFLPKENCRCWINEQGDDYLDETWKRLLTKAENETELLSDGGVVVMLTAKGAIETLIFYNENDAIDANVAIRFLSEKKKDGDAKIERLVYMWRGGCLDLPSFAFREVLLDVDKANHWAQILMCGVSGYVVRVVKETMPKNVYEDKK